MQSKATNWKRRGVIFLFLFFFSFSVVSAYNFEGEGVKIIDPLEENGGIPVNVQDQTTRPFAVKINQVLNPTITLSQDSVINSYDVNLTPGHGLSAGDELTILEQNGMARLWYGTIQGVVGDTITMDSPSPNNFTATGAVAFEYNSNLNVDGSATTQVFAITNFFTESVDITRVIFHCLDGSAMDDSQFCGINSLDRGLVFRKRLLDGEYLNYWTIKDNGEFKLLAYDTTYDDKAPAGLFGFATRLTYGGPSKHGVVIRLDPGEAIELLVQDDLTDLVRADFVLEGHFVQN